MISRFAVYEDCNITDVEICANNGVCRKRGSSYICECADGYTGISCQSGICVFTNIL